MHNERSSVFLNDQEFMIMHWSTVRTLLRVKGFTFHPSLRLIISQERVIHVGLEGLEQGYKQACTKFLLG